MSGFADLVKAELEKRKPDASKVKQWTEKIQFALAAASLVTEAGTIATALAAFLGG